MIHITFGEGRISRQMDNFGTFVFILIWSSIWGLATRKVIILKGYKENWFWLGFFFTFIAFIFALLRPLPPNDYVRSTHARSGTWTSRVTHPKKMLRLPAGHAPAEGIMHPIRQLVRVVGPERLRPSS